MGRAVSHSSPSQYFTWSVDASPVRVHLSIDLVRAMQPLLNGESVGRPKEIGGLLFGHAEPAGNGVNVWVDGYQTFDCEYVRGASWTLSRDDRRLFARTLEKLPSRAVVGWFRTHTRPGLYLDQHDFGLFSDFFPHPSSVALLIRPGAEGGPEAGFFVWEDGDMHRTSSYRVFPFRPEALAPAPARQTSLPDPAPTPVAARTPVAAAASARVGSAASSHPAWRNVLFAAPVAAGLAAGLFWNPEIIPGSHTGKPPVVAEDRVTTSAARVKARAPEADAITPARFSVSSDVGEPATAPVVEAAPPVPRPEPRKRAAAPAKRRLVAPPAARKAVLPAPVIETPPPAVALTAMPSEPIPFTPQEMGSLPAPVAEAEQRKPSGLRRAIAKIPGLGFLKKRKDATTDPEPQAVVEKARRPASALVKAGSSQH